MILATTEKNVEFLEGGAMSPASKKAANEGGHEHKSALAEGRVVDTTPNICHTPFPDFTDQV